MARQEILRVDRVAVRSHVGDKLRLYHLRRRIVRRRRDCSQRFRRITGDRHVWRICITSVDVRQAAVRERRRTPLVVRFRRQLLRRTVEPHAPDVACVEIAFVRGEQQLRAVKRERNGFDIVAAGRQTLRLAAVRGDGVDVLPAVALPRERNLIASEPPQLRRAHRRIELVAHPLVRAPDPMRDAAICVCDPDRPRKRCVTAAVEGRAVVDRFADLRAGRTHEGDARAVGRPRRRRVVRKGRRRVDVRFLLGRIDDDERVIAARVREGDLRAVGRPCYVANRSANRKRFRITGRERPIRALRKRDDAELPVGGRERYRVAFRVIERRRCFRLRASRVLHRRSVRRRACVSPAESARADSRSRPFLRPRRSHEKRLLHRSPQSPPERRRLDRRLAV